MIRITDLPIKPNSNYLSDNGLPDIKKKMDDAGADIVPMSVDQFAGFIKTESDKYARVVKATGIKPEQ